MEPVDVEMPEHDGAISKPILPDADVQKDNGKRSAQDESGDEKKPAPKKSKKNAPPPIKKRKTAIESSDEDEGASAQPEDAHQHASVAIKVDPDLPNPSLSPSSKPSSSKAKAKPSSAPSDEDDTPLAKTTTHIKPPSENSTADEKPAPLPLPDFKKKSSSSKKKDAAPKFQKEVKKESSPLSEDDKPLKVTEAKPKSRKKRKSSPVERDFSSEASEEEEEEEEEKPKPKPKKKAKKVAKEESGSEDDKPIKSKAKNKKSSEPKETAAEKKKKAANAKAKKEDDEAAEEEEKFKWWEEQQAQDSSLKWTTLEHQGVLFPPPYEPLPRSVKMRYDGQPLTLPPEAEEVAGFWAKMLESDHVGDKTFQANFFRDFMTVLAEHPPAEDVQVTDLKKCDFSSIAHHYDEEKAKQKLMTPAEKKELKKEKDEAEKKYTTCMLNGRKEKVGNFRVEPPSLFRGRGEHPRKGSLKLRLAPEDITINIGKEAPVPVPNIPGQWKSVQHDGTVTWLAMWKENINGNFKYVFLAPGSSLKGQSDMGKFEKARNLKKHIVQIRKDYMEELNSKVTAIRQRATAMYFIDKLALRAGNEKGEDEADTVGCCSLRVEHVGLIPPNRIRFDFLGKDSIRYVNEVEVNDQVFKNIKIFKRDPKVDGDMLFDRLDTGIVNKHLSTCMTGLSAKVFRTYNASHTMEQELENTPEDGTDAEKILAYNRANRKVAVLCNHQKAVGKGHAASMEKLGDKVLALKYQRMKLRHQLFNLEPKLKKKGKYANDESDLEEEWIESHEEELKLKAIEAAKKKFEKANEKKRAEGKDSDDEASLKKTIKSLEVEWEDIKTETTAKVAEPKAKGETRDKLEVKIGKIDERIAAAKMQVTDRNEGAEVALGTSKINYIDPRVTVAWAKKHDVPLEKMLSKVLIEKFQWALGTEADWKF